MSPSIILKDQEFPRQRIPNSQKDDAWAAACCDFVIAQGMACRDTTELDKRYSILAGNIPDEYYKKILNPYNATKEEYKRFPATLRNYDLIKGVIRRYVGEYIKAPNLFIVGANNPEVMLARDAKLRQELYEIVQQKIAAKIEQDYQQYIESGGDPNQFNPSEQFDAEAFIKEFNENYVDDISAQGQEIFNVIKDITNDELFYARAYFDYVTFGECYTYGDVVGNKLIKRNIMVADAFPIITDEQFREDDDMFACRRKMTYQQIIDEFDEYLDDKQLEFLNKYYATSSVSNPGFSYSIYESYFPDVCNKFDDKDREFFRNKNAIERDNSTGLYDVWHAVWRGEVRRAVVSFVNETGMLDQRIEEDGYKLNKAAGDIKIDYIYEPQVYESVRIGGRYDAIYPYKARAIAYNRGGKLPYNGVSELLPGFGRFSIIDIISPYQVFYNIVAYHREMVIAKNKLNVLMIAKSLLGKNPEDTLYKMIADGVLYVDDTDDHGMLRMQQVRYLSSSIGEYLRDLSTLLQEIEMSAKNAVDMTAQRYGEIANYAGKATTQEAVIRGAMGSVVIEFVMNILREKDYARDMDYSKLAWIDGLDTSYRGEHAQLKYISLDVDKHVYADYIIRAKNSAIEREKLESIKQFAFSAAQNGDMMMSIAAIEGDNISSITKLIKEFNAKKEAQEENLRQMDQETARMKQEFELQKIAAKGEEDRKTKELEGYIDSQIELIRADANMVSYQNGIDESVKNEGIDRLNDYRSDVEKQKIQLDRDKTMIDAYNKKRDREVKEKDIASKVQIARMNKNKYDFTGKKPNNKTK